MGTLLNPHNFLVILREIKIHQWDTVAFLNLSSTLNSFWPLLRIAIIQLPICDLRCHQWCDIGLFMIAFNKLFTRKNWILRHFKPKICIAWARVCMNNTCEQYLMNSVTINNTQWMVRTVIAWTIMVINSNLLHHSGFFKCTRLRLTFLLLLRSHERLE